MVYLPKRKTVSLYKLEQCIDDSAEKLDKMHKGTNV
jgi:hypothetical protein